MPLTFVLFIVMMSWILSLGKMAGVPKATPACELVSTQFLDLAAYKPTLLMRISTLPISSTPSVTAVSTAA